MRKPVSPTGGHLADCTCGNFEFRYDGMIPAIGYTCLPVKCPRCQRRFLIVVEVRMGAKPRIRVVRMVPMYGKIGIGLKQSLQQIPELTEDHIEYMLAVAQLLQDLTKVPA